MSAIYRLFCATLLVLYSQNNFAERIEVALGSSPALGVYLLLPNTANTVPAPLLILMPGGSGEEALARDLQYWLGAEFQQRGWAVAIPVSPNQRSFRGANNALVPQLIDKLQQDSRISGGKVLLAGISNGGMSALEIATTAPERFRGIVAVPAIVPRGLAVNSLAGMPIYLRIGDQDEMTWMTQLESTAQTLRDGGALVDADLVFMAPHMFQMEWETLDPWLEALPGATE